MTENDILALIKSDPWMMRVLRIAEKQHLKSWVIGAGFVRNKVWDFLHGRDEVGVDSPDVDLVYFDPDGNNQEADEILSRKLKKKTGIDFEIVNQVYAHKWHSLPPYKSIEHALYCWAETATGVGVRLQNGEVALIAPHGVSDLANLILRPSPGLPDNLDRMSRRIKEKNWLSKWPKLKIVN